MSAYRLPSNYDRTPLQRRASGFALALGVNILLLLVLLTISKFAPVARKESQALTVDLLPESHSQARKEEAKAVERPKPKVRPALKRPAIILPVKPTIQPPHFIPMTKDEMAAADVSNLPKADAGGGSAGDSEVVGKGPHGETLYAAEWAREPTDAELSGYLPHNLHDGWGLIACKTIAGNRVEDCVELGQDPPGGVAVPGQAAAQERPPAGRRMGADSDRLYVQRRRRRRRFGDQPWTGGAAAAFSLMRFSRMRMVRAARSASSVHASAERWQRSRTWSSVAASASSRA